MVEAFLDRCTIPGGRTPVNVFIGKYLAHVQRARTLPNIQMTTAKLRRLQMLSADGTDVLAELKDE